MENISCVVLLIIALHAVWIVDGELNKEDETRFGRGLAKTASKVHKDPPALKLNNVRSLNTGSRPRRSRGRGRVQRTPSYAAVRPPVFTPPGASVSPPSAPKPPATPTTATEPSSTAAGGAAGKPSLLPAVSVPETPKPTSKDDGSGGTADKAGTGAGTGEKSESDEDKSEKDGDTNDDTDKSGESEKGTRDVDEGGAGTGKPDKGAVGSAAIGSDDSSKTPGKEGEEEKKNKDGGTDGTTRNAEGQNRDIGDGGDAGAHGSHGGSHEEGHGGASGQLQYGPGNAEGQNRDIGVGGDAGAHGSHGSHGGSHEEGHGGASGQLQYGPGETSAGDAGMRSGLGGQPGQLGGQQGQLGGQQGQLGGQQGQLGGQQGQLGGQQGQGLGEGHGPIAVQQGGAPGGAQQQGTDGESSSSSESGETTDGEKSQSSGGPETPKGENDSGELKLQGVGGMLSKKVVMDAADYAGGAAAGFGVGVGIGLGDDDDNPRSFGEGPVEERASLPPLATNEVTAMNNPWVYMVNDMANDPMKQQALREGAKNLEVFHEKRMEYMAEEHSLKMKGLEAEEGYWEVRKMHEEEEYKHPVHCPLNHYPPIPQPPGTTQAQPVTKGP